MASFGVDWGDGYTLHLSYGRSCTYVGKQPKDVSGFHGGLKGINMETRELTNCPDCGAKPGETHMPGCDCERCSVCGKQKIQCHCEGHDPFFARWTGLWPGVTECVALGMFAKWPGKDDKWEKCGPNDPEGGPDLNTFYSSGLYKKFFVKPTTDNGRKRYEEAIAEKAS